MKDKLYIGVDVSKNWIDIGTHGQSKTQRIDNDETAVAAWVGSLAPRDVALVCFEPTGGYERLLRHCLRDAGIPFARVHPNQIAAYRKMRGIKAKTDAKDALLLASFGADERAARGVAAIDADETLRALSARRRQLLDMRQAERCRLATAASSTNRPWLRRWTFNSVNWRSRSAKAVSRRWASEAGGTGAIRLIVAYQATIAQSMRSVFSNRPIDRAKWRTARGSTTAEGMPAAHSRAKGLRS